MFREIYSAAEAAAYLPLADGLVLVGADACAPCALAWEVLGEARFGALALTKIQLSLKTRDGCAFMRQQRISAYPTFFFFTAGALVARFDGAPAGDRAELSDWMGRKLLLQCGIELPANGAMTNA